MYVAILVVVAVAAYFAYISWVQAPQVSEGNLIGNGVLSYPESNFEMNVAEGWSESSVSMAPAQIPGALFQLDDSNSSCSIQYVRARVSDLAIPPLVQVSFGERFSTADGSTQFDPSWWVHQNLAPDSLTFSDFARQPVSGEILMLSNYEDMDENSDYRRVFALFDRDGGTVAEGCVDDFYAMISSMTFAFDPVDLDSSSEGILYARISHPDPIRLLFRSEDGISRQVDQLPDGDFSALSVRGGMFYYITERGIASRNIFTDERSSLFVAPEGEHVVDFLMSDDSVFVMTTPVSSGMHCVDGRACTVRFHRITGSGAQRLPGEAYARVIVGYAATENALYVQSGYGDAGCFSAIISKYDITTGSAIEVVNTAACADESVYEDAVADVEAVTDRFSDQINSAPYVEVRNGRMYAPSQETQMQNSLPIRVFSE